MPESMLRLLIAAGLCLLAHPDPAHNFFVLKVYIGNTAGKPVPLEGGVCTIVADIEGFGKRTVHTSLVRPDMRANKGLAHGGEVRSSDAHQVEFVVANPHAPVDSDDPHFEGILPSVLYACPRKHETTIRDLPCTDCGGSKAVKWITFTAVVAFKLDTKPTHIKGFSFPTISKSEDALKWLELRWSGLREEIDAEGLTHDRVHRIQARLIPLCERMKDLAEKKDRAELEKIGSAIIELTWKADEALHSERGVDSDAFLKRLSGLIENLRRHVKR